MLMKNRGQRLISLCWLVGYILFVLLETVFFREAQNEYSYNFHPFWSYMAILNGSKYLIVEHLLNVALFVPVGAFLWLSLKKRQLWKALLFGCLVSVSIEILQLALKRGLCEFDDVFHNTLGCLIGFGIISMMALLWRKVTESKKC